LRFKKTLERMADEALRQHLAGETEDFDPDDIMDVG
jgi:hypothetical protein